MNGAKVESQRQARPKQIRPIVFSELKNNFGGKVRKSKQNEQRNQETKKEKETKKQRNKERERNKETKKGKETK